VKNRAAGIELYLEKLIETDVRVRGSMLIALLPNLSHTSWFRRYVLGGAHEIHFIAGKLVFPNQFTDLERKEKAYLWDCRSYILCVWRASTPPLQPAMHWLELDAAPDEQLQLRSCRQCQRVRVLPRWVAEPSLGALRPGVFQCSDNPDVHYNRCDCPEFVPIAA
jgi:hypothetical protein